MPKVKKDPRLLSAAGRIGMARRWGNPDEEARARRELILARAEKMRRDAEALIASVTDES